MPTVIWIVLGILTLFYALNQPYNKNMSGVGDGIACFGLVIAWPVFWLGIGVRYLILKNNQLKS